MPLLSAATHSRHHRSDDELMHMMTRVKETDTVRVGEHEDNNQELCYRPRTRFIIMAGEAEN